MIKLHNIKEQYTGNIFLAMVGLPQPILVLKALRTLA